MRITIVIALQPTAEGRQAFVLLSVETSVCVKCLELLIARVLQGACCWFHANLGTFVCSVLNHG